MLSDSYKEYINSERWKQKTKLYWDTKGRWCRGCHSRSNLKLHHLSYDHFGHEPLEDLIGLCQTCHLEVHRLHRAGGRRTDMRTVTLRFVRHQALLRLRKKNT